MEAVAGHILTWALGAIVCGVPVLGRPSVLSSTALQDQYFMKDTWDRQCHALGFF